jgi:hypothetical protein
MIITCFEQGECGSLGVQKTSKNTVVCKRHSKWNRAEMMANQASAEEITPSAKRHNDKSSTWVSVCCLIGGVAVGILMQEVARVGTQVRSRISYVLNQLLDISMDCLHALQKT